MFFRFFFLLCIIIITLNVHYHSLLHGLAFCQCHFHCHGSCPKFITQIQHLVFPFPSFPLPFLAATFVRLWTFSHPARRYSRRFGFIFNFYYADSALVGGRPRGVGELSTCSLRRSGSLPCCGSLLHYPLFGCVFSHPIVCFLAWHCSGYQVIIYDYHTSIRCIRAFICLVFLFLFWHCSSFHGIRGCHVFPRRPQDALWTFIQTFSHPARRYSRRFGFIFNFYYADSALVGGRPRGVGELSTCSLRRSGSLPCCGSLLHYPLFGCVFSHPIVCFLAWHCSGYQVIIYDYHTSIRCIRAFICLVFLFLFWHCSSFHGIRGCHVFPRRPQDVHMVKDQPACVGMPRPIPRLKTSQLPLQPPPTPHPPIPPPPGTPCRLARLHHFLISNNSLLQHHAIKEEGA